MKRFYRSVWVSDVHLGRRDSQSQMFYSFLDSIKCDYLYLVGDIVDVWAMRRKWYWPKQYNEVLHKLLKRSRKGARVFYVPGNHDEFFREFEGLRFGDVEVVRDTIHETADGRRFFVTHGDQFDTVVLCHKWLSLLGDWAYSFVVSLNHVVNGVRRMLGMPYWSMSGAIKRRVKQAVNFITNFEDILVRDAQRHEVDGVICGHIHQPAMRKIGDIEYCNTGDWIENCTALVEHPDGKIELLWWHAEVDQRCGDMANTVTLPPVDPDVSQKPAAARSA